MSNYKSGECQYRGGLICFENNCERCGFNPKEEERRKKIELTEVDGLYKKVLKGRTKC